MYLRLTERCNMTCAHCCFSDTAKGEDMPSWIFHMALDLAVNRGDYVTLGGGEPTVHPQFFNFLETAMSYAENGALEMAPLVVTNGKRTRIANRLLDLIEIYEREVVIDLSLDRYHSPIDSYVQRRAEKMSRASYRRGTVGIRNASRLGGLLPVGRALENQLVPPDAKACCCEDAVVTPSGDIYSCGCMHTKIGHVSDPQCLDGYNRDYAHTGGFAEPELDAA